MTEDSESKKEKSKLSRRDFLKYSAGVAAVAASAAALMDKLPFTSPQSEKSRSLNQASSGEPMVVAVHGDELTLISGDRSMKVKDATLAAMIAGRSEEEE